MSTFAILPALNDRFFKLGFWHSVGMYMYGPRQPALLLEALRQNAKNRSMRDQPPPPP